MTQRILLVSNNDHHQAVLEEAVQTEDCTIVKQIKTSTMLATELQMQVVDIVIMILDSNGTELLETLQQVMENKPLPVVMFVQQGDRQSAAAATAAGVSAYVLKGLQPERVAPILAAATARFQEKRTLLGELVQARTSLEERKVIERAKGLLMEQRNCNENEAYTALRQLAMERNKRLAEVAQGMIDSLNLLKS